MLKNNIKHRQGFTIIEVVLVLAIAGLIFMMVFLALPALQRSQRDTQRSDDISRLAAQLTQYKTDHRGALPSAPGGGSYYGVLAKLNESTNTVTTTAIGGTNSTPWKTFYDSYLTQNGATTFEDPGGNPYSLSIGNCKGQDDATCNQIAQTFNSTLSNNVRSLATLVGGESQPSQSSFESQASVITITAHAQCNNTDVKFANGARQVAIRYVKESGGVICLSN